MDPLRGSVTPWGTHLGGEEYEPNAKEFENEPLQTMNCTPALWVKPRRLVAAIRMHTDSSLKCR